MFSHLDENYVLMSLALRVAIKKFHSYDNFFSVQGKIQKNDNLGQCNKWSIFRFAIRIL